MGKNPARRAPAKQVAKQAVRSSVQSSSKQPPQGMLGLNFDKLPIIYT